MKVPGEGLQLPHPLQGLTLLQFQNLFLDSEAKGPSEGALVFSWHQKREAKARRSRGARWAAGGSPSPPHRHPLTCSTQSGISGVQGSVPALSTDSTSFSSSSHPVDGQTDRGGSGLEPSPAVLLLMNEPWVGRAAGRQITQVSKRPTDHSKAERWGTQLVEKPGQAWVQGAEIGSCPPDVLPLGLTSIGNTQKTDSQMWRASHRQRESRRPSWRRGCKAILPAWLQGLQTHTEFAGPFTALRAPEHRG